MKGTIHGKWITEFDIYHNKVWVSPNKAKDLAKVHFITKQKEFAREYTQTNFDTIKGGNGTVSYYTRKNGFTKKYPYEKVILKHVNLEKAHVENALREIYINVLLTLNRSQTPRPAFLGAWTASSHLYMVFEDGGRDLYSYITEDIETTSFAESKRHILSAIFECVNQFHREGIAHLDLKPENIIIREHKDTHRWEALLIDLGSCTFKSHIWNSKTFLVSTTSCTPPSFLQYSLAKDKEPATLPWTDFPPEDYSTSWDIWALAFIILNMEKDPTIMMDEDTLVEYLHAIYSNAFLAKHDSAGYTLVNDLTFDSLDIRPMINTMLRFDCNSRPTIQTIINWFNTVYERQF